MPLLIIVVGLILIVTAIRGTTGDLAMNLGADMSSGFVKWLAAVIAIGALGYIPGLEKPSRYLMALVAIVILLTSGKGFVEQFVQQIENPPQPKTAQPAGGSAQLPAFPISSSSGGGTSGGLSSGLGSSFLGGADLGLGGSGTSSLTGIAGDAALLGVL